MTNSRHSLCPDWESWRISFERRRGRPLPDPFAEEPELAMLPPSVARSLAVFQLGESGGGTIVEQARRSRLAATKGGYADAMALFVEEEHYHAELLACGVRMLGGRLLRENWTAKLFVFGRRLLGLRLKVTVLLVAEVVGICYYHLLASKLPPCRLRALLDDIVADELTHLDFHCSFLRTQTASRPRRMLFRLVWRCLTTLAASVVLLDHRRTLADLGISRRTAWQRWMFCSRRAEQLASGTASAGSTLVERPSAQST